jgi:hypothetical protein
MTARRDVGRATKVDRPVGWSCAVQTLKCQNGDLIRDSLENVAMETLRRCYDMIIHPGSKDEASAGVLDGLQLL